MIPISNPVGQSARTIPFVQNPHNLIESLESLSFSLRQMRAMAEIAHESDDRTAKVGAAKVGLDAIRNFTLKLENIGKTKQVFKCILDSEGGAANA